MRLQGVYQSSKSGIFRPEGTDEAYPYAFCKITDNDGEGEWVNVKPSSGEVADMEAFKAHLAKFAKGAPVDWVVSLDRFGKLRFVAEAGK